MLQSCNLSWKPQKSGFFRNSATLQLCMQPLRNTWRKKEITTEPLIEIPKQFKLLRSEKWLL